MKHRRQLDRRQDVRLSGSARSMVRHRLKAVALMASKATTADAASPATVGGRGAAPSQATRQQSRRSSSFSSSFNRLSRRHKPQGIFDACDVSQDNSFRTHKADEGVMGGYEVHVDRIFNCRCLDKSIMFIINRLSWKIV